MSEAGTLTYNPLPPAIRKPGTVGRVGINHVRVVDTTGRDLPVNEEGEVIASGPTVVEGYWRDPAATAEAFAWLALFNAFLNRASGETDIVVGVPVQGRDRPETLGVVGFFINMLPVRTDVSGDPSFRGLLARVRKGSAADLAHQHVPFERIVEELQPGRRIGETPLFNTTCVLLDDTSRVVRSGWAQGVLEFDRGTVPFDFGLTLNQTTSGSRLSLRYNSALFTAATIERMASQFLRLLEGIVADPDRPISDASLLAPTERDEIVMAWNRTNVEYSGDRPLQSLFESQVDATPDAVAVSDGRSRLTYLQLDEEANHLAQRLHGRGVGPNVVVGYLARRSNDPVLDSDLRHFLRETLPDFMIPDSFVWLERLPLTPNGKIDRSALPHEPTGAPRREIAPRTPTERAVASIWAEHLGLVSVGIDDDFFDLGGHSLLAVKLVTALELKFGLSLPLALLFEAPTVSALARAIDGRTAGTGSTRVINIQARGRRTPIFA